MPHAPHRNERERLVILGSGFAAVMIQKRIDLKRYDVTVISPRNHFLFTPLLPSTTVGTVEFRSIIEPIRAARNGVDFIHARCTSVDPVNKSIQCVGVEVERQFAIDYDKLVIAVGAQNNTFGVPGVEQHALFLKELADARELREQIISCLEEADLPDTPPEERDRLLHFVIVGGGPTGVEFAAELHDLVEESLGKNYPDLQDHVTITLCEAQEHILSAFDRRLRHYTSTHFVRAGIDVKLNAQVANVGPGLLELSDGSHIRAGLILWSTGYAPVPFVEKLPFTKEKGRILVDEYLRVPSHPDIFAIGDCATTAGSVLPQTAQVAMQGGKYLAAAFNRRAKGKDVKPFSFNDMGMLAYIGESEALAEIPKARLRWRGALTYFFWRSAYLTRLVTLKNKILVLFDWVKTRLFGRDLSKF